MGANIGPIMTTLEARRRVQLLDPFCVAAYQKFCATPWTNDWMDPLNYGATLGTELQRENAFGEAYLRKVNTERYAPSDSGLVSWIRARSEKANARLCQQGGDLLIKDYGDLLQSILFELVCPLFQREGYARPSISVYENRCNTAKLMRGVGFTSWAMRRNIGVAIWNEHTLADYGEAMLFYLAEKVCATPHGQSNTALEVLYLVAICLFCLASEPSRP